MAKDLIPRDDGGMDFLCDLVSKHGVSLQTMFDGDSLAISVDDMRYFPASYWGRVPSYAVFMRRLRSECPEKELELREMEAEALGGAYEAGMKAIYEKPTEEMDGNEGKRFNWAERLYRVQERKLDRIAKRRGEDSVDKGVDLAVKVISALSNAQLLKAKEIVEAEWNDGTE